MIIYNVRNMGPYQSDVLCLNIYQIYNKVREAKAVYNGHAIHSQLKELDDIIKEMTLCEDSNTLIERLLLLKKARDNR